MNASIVAVVVTYNSNISSLSELLSILVPQCVVVVIDNSTEIFSRDLIQNASFQTAAHYLSLGDNFGIAHAQNVGIAWAKDNGALDVLLMDDDSLPSSSFIKDLIFEREKSLIQPVVVSARITNANGDDISNRSIMTPHGLTPCSELTSSGTLIPMKLFDRVGLFNTNLFIDCVDFEWGWRALSEGIPLFLCDQIFIRHKLGDGECLGLKIPSPIRHYYQCRNVLRMIVGSKAPFRWRLLQSIKMPIKIILIMVLATQRLDRIRYMTWGLFDFFIGRNGRFNH